MKCVFHWHSVGAQGNELRLTDINQMTFKETKKKELFNFQREFNWHLGLMNEAFFVPYLNLSLEKEWS